MYCPGYHSILLLLLFGFLFLLLLHLFLFLFFLLFFLFCFLLFLLLSFLLFRLLLLLSLHLGRQDSTLEDEALLLLLLLLPLLDLGLIVFHLRIECLKKLWDVSCRDWSVQLQLVKELESLSVVLDWLGTITAAGGLGLLRLALLGGREEILFLTILFLPQHSLVVFVVKHCLLFVFLLLGGILGQQSFAEFDCLLNQRDLIQVWLLIHLLHLSLQLIPPLLFLVCCTRCLLLRAACLSQFGLISLEGFFLRLELVPELIALFDLCSDLFLKFVALFDDLGQIA
mmetsp:Transcript_4946/g.9510  ORF Transcript_4946/g.9510 Transcript_4946/m.9510 type:complete len:284 (+) Transcript_4946:177-1028(+)